ncbi:hypothetical protein [Paracidovorax wautersii]|uniref:hypothetical protein n=1 Tax=Paracidovorax wautersii TaxID=1177982 RepID=UPI0031E00B72
MTTVKAATPAGPGPGPSHGDGDGGEAVPTDIESAAFPPLVRALAVLIVAGLAAFALWSLPALRAAQWNFTALATFALAAVLIGWVGWWMVFSRTRFCGGAVVQTWLWDKRVRVEDVATFKIVHWPWLQAIVAPRMLVRRRGGGITWVHAADPALLVAFGQAVIRQGMAPPGTPPAAD